MIYMIWMIWMICFYVHRMYQCSSCLLLSLVLLKSGRRMPWTSCAGTNSSPGGFQHEPLRGSCPPGSWHGASLNLEVESVECISIIFNHYQSTFCLSIVTYQSDLSFLIFLEVRGVAVLLAGILAEVSSQDPIWQLWSIWVGQANVVEAAKAQEKNGNISFFQCDLRDLFDSCDVFDLWFENSCKFKVFKLFPRLYLGSLCSCLRLIFQDELCNIHLCLLSNASG